MVLICASGFGVIDYLFLPVDYSSPGFKRFMSKTRGDGGLSPGRLCFVDAWEKFAGMPISEIAKVQGWDREPDSFNVGGPCIVAAINASQMLEESKVKVKFYGAMGRDATAERLLTIVAKTPLDVSHLKKHDKGVTPYAVCLSDPKFNNGHGERSFAVNIGVYQNLRVEDIVADSFFEGDILYFGATALTPSIHSNLTALLRRGHELGRINVVGTVFDHLSESKNPCKPWSMGESDESFKYMDLLTVDWDEALGISGKQDIHEAVKFFQDKGVHALTVTHGPEPLYAYSDGTLFKQMSLRTFPVSKAIADEVRVDSVGAGDNFAGGVLGAIGEALDRGVARGKLDLVDAIAWGCASGAFTLKIVGGTYLEKYPGEKRKLVNVYRKKYLQQLADAKL